MRCRGGLPRKSGEEAPVFQRRKGKWELKCFGLKEVRETGEERGRRNMISPTLKNKSRKKIAQKRKATTNDQMFIGIKEIKGKKKRLQEKETSGKEKKKKGLGN